MDVFRGQTTREVISKLEENKVVLVQVPANMTHIFQPLDLTVNGYCKRFMKNKFAEWYSKQVSIELENGKELADIDIKFRLTTLKPLHASWIAEFYNHMTTKAGSEISINGWRASGIADAINFGTEGLPSLDPFQDIVPLVSNMGDSEWNIGTISEEVATSFVNDRDDSGSEWGEEVEDSIDFHRNVFADILDDEDGK